MPGDKRKVLKAIRIDLGKCTGCRACEVACSSYHSEPKFGAVNPKRSRIRVVRDEARDLFVPILAGPYTDEECKSRPVFIIGGKEYSQCSFCRASCSTRDLFKEPDCSIPLKCDMCGEPMPEGGPFCVRRCLHGALVYSEVEGVEQATVERGAAKGGGNLKEGRTTSGERENVRNQETIQVRKVYHRTATS